MGGRFWSTCILYLISGIVSEVSMKSKEKKQLLCPGLQSCECKPVQKVMHVRCWDVNDLTDVRRLLSKNLAKTVIDKLVLNNCSASVIPNDFIENFRDIKEFTSYCPLEHVEENAFAKVRSLHQVIIRNSNFTEIPIGLQSIPKVQKLYIVGGSLKKLDKELWKMSNLNHVTLQKTALVDISSEAFKHNVMIVSLDLSQNHLTHIEDGTLDHLKKLIKIVLARNKLLTLEKAFITISPQIIDVSSNELEEISNAFPETIRGNLSLNLRSNPLKLEDLVSLSKKLKDKISLDISECNLTRLDGLVTEHSTFDVLHASHNMLTDIPVDDFRRIRILRRVDLSYNKLTNIGDIFVGKKQLFTINLDKNDIFNLETSFVNISNLRTLYLSGNKIQNLNRGTFSGTSNLRNLNVSSNLISLLNEDSFFDQRNIDVLDLSGNRFPSLNGSLVKLSRLAKLKLDGGFLEYIDESDLPAMHSLHTLSLRGNRLRRVDGAFRSLLSLKYLDLADNKLRTLSRNSFPENMKITQSWLAGGNEWECDCRLLWLLEWGKKDRVKDNPTCRYPLRLRGLPFSKLTANDLSDRIDDCPEECNCLCRLERGDSIVEVDCSNKSLNKVPDILPPHTRILKMHNNSLTGLHFGNFTKLEDMRCLDLSSNRIEYIDGQFPRGLRVLHLNDNRLKRLPKILDDINQLQQLSLSGNPWLCDCNSISFRKWLVAFIDKIGDAHAVLCGEDLQNGNLIDSLIASMSDEELCPPNRKSEWPSAAVIGSITAVLLVIAVFVVLYCCNKMTINSWLYSRGLGFLKRNEDDTGKVFDALLLYGSRDHEFVVQNISTRLENEKPHYKVSCLQTRDVSGSRDMAVNMTTVLTNCKRVIVILSPAFLDDEICVDTLRRAFTLFQREDICRIIVIKYIDIQSKQALNTRLKEKIESSCTLRWKDKMFWLKLRYVMPKKND